ncbi:hypothetical protein [Marinoscillum furvescens]|uniref:Uncharacterized protein n=1 Tax=Marinoscillum furvescens DSM 4134 TaxID=1122208 RepID=A0A3D9L4L3_MARFU|nr:hypothetical protein [Marinoscillum furvescens]REE00459.1 hypothetical protein C7460_10580 [Marinoscillum furvescens DSM 4134]
MYQPNRIAQDHELILADFSEDELKMGLECSLKVKHHLEKQVRDFSKVKYMNNLDALEAIITKYEIALAQYKMAQ